MRSRPAAAAAVAALAFAAAGCHSAIRALPRDLEAMRFAGTTLGTGVARQWDLTTGAILDLPATTAAHFRSRLRHWDSTE